MRFLVTFNQANGDAVSISSMQGGDDPYTPPGMACLVMDGVAMPELPGYVQGGQYIKRPRQPSADHEWDVQAKAWAFRQEAKDTRLAKLAFDALDQIDQAAGTVRMRYITSVPGQAETYQRKEQQAREWKAAGYAGTPPVFIAAEAAALGQDPVDVADYIIETADQWGSFKGPQIEAMRRKWKVAIEQAGTDEVAIRLARDSGLVELMAL